LSLDFRLDVVAVEVAARALELLHQAGLYGIDRRAARWGYRLAAMTEAFAD
jgi:hypothetical protein